MPDHETPTTPDPVDPTLAVAVPATDRPATLSDCLGALDRSTRIADETIVQRAPAGAGPALARNLAAERSRAEVIVFVDADVRVHDDALARIEAAFREDPELVAVFGAYDDRPAAPGVVSGFRNLLHHHVHATGRGPAETFWAGLGAVRRDALLAAGGFDARRYPEPSIEDIELGARLRGRGHAIRLDPRIRGTHLKRWSLGSMVRTDLLRRGAPWALLQLESGAVSGALNMSARHRASAAASLVLALAAAARRPLPAAAATLALLALNRRFYALLGRRGGPRLAAAGPALHVLHHLTAVAAVGIAAVRHAIAGSGPGR